MSDLNFAIATGTGRCGTQFLARLLALSPEVATRHDPNPMALTFHRYCTWNNLPVDQTSFFAAKRKEIEEDLKQSKLSFHSSAHMALSVEALQHHFNGKVVIMYRHPADVVNSYMGKGYYQEDYAYSELTKAVGYQEVGALPHHFFGRLVPRGEYFKEWATLTRVGKIAWMWATVNKEIERQLAGVDQEKKFVSKLEEFDYDRYLLLCNFLSITAVAQAAFKELRELRPNRLKTSGTYTVADWTLQERQEFTDQVSAVAERLGYDLDLKTTVHEAPIKTGQDSILKKVKQGISRLLE